MKERAEWLRAEKGGKVLRSFQAVSRFESRYSTFGFHDVGSLGDGAGCPTVFAVIGIGPAEQERRSPSW